MAVLLILMVCSFFLKESCQDELSAESTQILSLLRILHSRSLEQRAHMQRMETLMREILTSGKGDEALKQSITFITSNVDMMAKKLSEIETKITSPNLHASQIPSNVPVSQNQLLINMQATLNKLDQNIQSLQRNPLTTNSQSLSTDEINRLLQMHINRLEQNINKKIEYLADKPSSTNFNRPGNSAIPNTSSTLILTGRDVAQLIQEAFNTGLTAYSSNTEEIFDRNFQSLENLLHACTQEIKHPHYYPQSNPALELTSRQTRHQPTSQQVNPRYSSAGIDIISPPSPNEYLEVGKRLKSSSTYNRSYLKERPKDCAEIFNLGLTKTGVYEAYVEHYGQSVPVYCDMNTKGGGWTVVLRRDNSRRPPVNFDKPWTAYKNGFGDLNGEFWLGNKHIHSLTSGASATVRFEITDNLGRHGFAEYEGLFIHNEHQKYLLYVGVYNDGNIPDELTSHNGTYFSTPEIDNDRHPGRNCAETFFAGWWYDNCMRVILTGQHVFPFDSKAIQGIYWGFRFPGNQRLRGAEMKIRPSGFRHHHS